MFQEKEFRHENNFQSAAKDLLSSNIEKETAKHEGSQSKIHKVMDLIKDFNNKLESIVMNGLIIRVGYDKENNGYYLVDNQGQVLIGARRANLVDGIVDGINSYKMHIGAAEIESVMSTILEAPMVSQNGYYVGQTFIDGKLVKSYVGIVMLRPRDTIILTAEAITKINSATSTIQSLDPPNSVLLFSVLPEANQEMILETRIDDNAGNFAEEGFVDAGMLQNAETKKKLIKQRLIYDTKTIKDNLARDEKVVHAVLDAKPNPTIGEASVDQLSKDQIVEIKESNEEEKKLREELKEKEKYTISGNLKKDGSETKEDKAEENMLETKAEDEILMKYASIRLTKTERTEVLKKSDIRNANAFTLPLGKSGATVEIKFALMYEFFGQYTQKKELFWKSMLEEIIKLTQKTKLVTEAMKNFNDGIKIWKKDDSEMDDILDNKKKKKKKGKKTKEEDEDDEDKEDDEEKDDEKEEKKKSKKNESEDDEKDEEDSKNKKKKGKKNQHKGKNDRKSKQHK